MVDIMEVSVGDIVRIGGSLHRVVGYDMGSLLIVWQLSEASRHQELHVGGPRRVHQDHPVVAVP